MDMNPAIFELQDKVNDLVNWAHQANVRTLMSRRSIADAMKTPRGTFESNLKSGRMSLANQAALSKLFGFSRDWPEWLDPDASRNTPAARRKDTPEAFIDRFRAHKSRKSKSKRQHLTIEPALTEALLDHRFVDFRLVPSDRLEVSDGEHIDLALALFFGGSGLSVFDEETGEVQTVGLKQAELQLFSDRPTANIEVRGIECRGEAEGNFIGTPEGLRPRWVFKVAKTGAPWMAGRRLRNQSQDCICTGFRDADKIRAIMSATIQDCLAKIVSERLQKLSPEKQQFVHQLYKLAALNGTEAILCTQELTVVRKS
jgi:hypothetical protein